MKIGLLSESPSLTTGFGIVANQIATGLSLAGHEVVCFGINALGETFPRAQYPYRIWAVGTDGLIQTLSEFLKYEQIDLLFINFDIISCDRWTSIARAIGWSGPIGVYFVIDGLPIDREYVEFLETLEIKIAATDATSEFLKSLGIQGVKVAPHGVSLDYFRPLQDRSELRRKAQVDENFVVGVFGRNNERKQTPRVIKALSQLRKSGNLENTVLYCHCQPKDDPGLGGWNLFEVAKRLEVEDIVFFPHGNFRQTTGVPLLFQEGKVHEDESPSPWPSFPSYYNYVERINCCDLIVNPAFCGGFELGILEAQACGVPIAVTNDEGNMAEVVGEGGFLLTARDVGLWKTGANQFFVSPSTIAECISKVRADKHLRKSLAEQGKANAKKFLWDRLRECILKEVATL